MTNFATLSEYWLFFANEARLGGSPLYERLSLAIAEDPEIQDLGEAHRPGQPPANLLFGAVQFLLLGGAKSDLRLWYPHLRKEGEAAPTTDAWPVFRAFCIEHRGAILDIVARRVTNTNEVRRCVLLYPAFAHVARVAGAPLHLREVGPSAGLNLVFDRYGYRYAHASGEIVRNGSSPLVLETELRGGRPKLPETMPAIASRAGLELNPVNLQSEADRRWLKSLLWPGRSERFVRMDAALALAANDPPAIHAGDALELLPRAVAAVPQDEPLLVYHSFVTYQFSPAMRERLDAILREAGERRPVHRLQIEWDGTYNHPIRHTLYDHGRESEAILGKGQAHGEWLEWQI